MAVRLLERDDAVAGVSPGAYGNDPPTLDHPEILLLATRGTNG